jgi:L,D-transpeptidase YcbB
VFIPPRITAKIARNCCLGPRALVARGSGLLTALVAVVALTAAGAFAQAPVTGAAMAPPASLQPADAAASPAAGDSEIRNRIETGMAYGGERLHVSLLRQFYAAHNFEPVWAARPAQAEALLNTVLRSGEHGLDPDLFHAALLRNAAALPPIDRELLLSDAFLGYADALARGAVPIEIRMDDEDLTPEPIAIASVLDNAMSSADPAAVIEALAPNSPEYMALRNALRAYRSGVADGRAPALGGADDGVRGTQHQARGHALKATPEAAFDRSGQARLRQIVVNLERWRWLPRNLPAERVWVNIPNAQLVLYRDNRPIFTTRVVVGQTDWQTPELRASIESLLFNPPWNVPPSIAAQEIMPKVARDPDYLSKHHMVVRANGAIQQLPGQGTALGQLKFELPNRFDVYLHDTPLKNLFARDNRRQSHGCVRVENPRELAALLLQQPVEVINKGIGLGYTNRRALPGPVPVFLVYQTAFVGAGGSIEFRPDVYNRDDEIWQHLHPLRQAPVAERELAGQRRG